MKKIFIRFSVMTLSAILLLGVISANAQTGIDDGTVRFPSEYGDVNDDGAVNILDLVRLKKYIAKIPNVNICKSASDLNGDGEYDAADLSELRALLLYM